IERFLAPHAADVSVSVIDPKGQRDYLEADGERVPLLCADNDLEVAPGQKSKRVCYLGTDNIKAGRRLGELVEKALPNGGTVAFFVGRIEPVNARERWQGTMQY